ncbi:leucine-rich repeat-containing protein 40-like [Pogonomyrmex barbatus]|uniref:Leucine-rich repeat-containing protein 40-like n=1 Tax=Pogonomyrmex barbatus TaxID=144034 RepID=A0A6I9WDB0_9HYME|nr:leucine-rich repeat-containing protein 40-like [Pogonomyrmex barbatus]XP_011640284.1 leucine-rich repeat-containing protein 40-like [Pogonomyrmex barbatus]XP_011640285.1 leucine-rich repeat-containing protein 40-like [Pogonomyrmex barbatus]
MNIVSLILFHLFQIASKIFAKRQIKKQENYLKERMRKWTKWMRKRSVELYANRFLRTSGLNNIATYRFLKCIILQNSMIFALSKEIGNLPCLEQLDLSNNFLRYYNNHEWLWLEQIPIRNNLMYLNLSKNLLTVLPIQIIMLRKLKKLCISHNRLTHLPQALGFLRHLMSLDVSNNKLAYLPTSIFKNNLYLNIMSNPLNYPLREIMMPLESQSLFEFSARIVIKQWRQSDFAGELSIPNEITRHLFDMKYCNNCGHPCLDYYVKSYGVYCTISHIFIFYGYNPLERNSVARICFHPRFLERFILEGLPPGLYLTIEFCFCSRRCFYNCII